MVQETEPEADSRVQDALIEVAAEETLDSGGSLKELKDITKELENIMPSGGGSAMGITSTAEKVPVWNTFSGRMSWILTDQIKFQIKKRHPEGHPMAGQRVFTGTAPPVVESDNKVHCWLHKDSPMREWLDGIGLEGQVCLHVPLPTELAARTHTERKHTPSFRIIQDERFRQEQREDRAIQKANLEALQTISKRIGVSAPDVSLCEVEGCVRFFDNSDDLTKHTKKDHKPKEDSTEVKV